MGPARQLVVRHPEVTLLRSSPDSSEMLSLAQRVAMVMCSKLAAALPWPRGKRREASLILYGLLCDADMRHAGLRHIAGPMAPRGWTTSQRPSRSKNNKGINSENTAVFQRVWDATLLVVRWHVAVAAITARHLRRYLPGG